MTGILGLWGGGTGTLLRQMTYSMMRFAIYDTVKAKIHTGESSDSDTATTPLPVKGICACYRTRAGKEKIITGRWY
jgi:hypothetical protein